MRALTGNDPKDDGRNGNHDGGEDDHVKDPADVLGVAHDQMESRVQHQGLWDDHYPPTKVDRDDGRVQIRPDLKIPQHDGQRLEHDAPRSDGTTPKVESPPAPEEEEQPDVELDGDVPGDSCKGRYGHGDRKVVSDVGNVTHNDGRAGPSAPVAKEDGEREVKAIA